MNDFEKLLGTLDDKKVEVLNRNVEKLGDRFRRQVFRIFYMGKMDQEELAYCLNSDIYIATLIKFMGDNFSACIQGMVVEDRRRFTQVMISALESDLDAT